MVQDPNRSDDGANPFARLVREAIDRLATPEVRERILASALTLGELRRLPDDSGSFGTFACGPLRTAITAALGEAEAEAILADLGPAFAQEGTGASSGIRRRKRHSMPAPSSVAPIVVIATEDEDVRHAVQPIADRAKLIVVGDIFALLQAAHAHLLQPLHVFVHDSLPSARGGALTTLARVMPSTASVKLWGRGGGGVPSEWRHVGDVPPAQLARIVLSGLPTEEVALPPRAPRVLVADEDPTWRARMMLLLESAGYEVVSAPDGFFALERCIDERPDAVLAGMELGTLDGPQLAMLLRTRFGEDAPPVILFTDAAELPEPPNGVVAVTRRAVSPADVLEELGAWVGPGAND
ncbi:MAG: response regulator [Sandaracinaceae bacterium]|nr:response regulator [Sandaracinaceae bacterium]